MRNILRMLPIIAMISVLFVSVVPTVFADDLVCENADVVLVMDRSGSMSGSQLTLAKTAAKNFVDQLTAGDRPALVSFSSSASLNQGLTSDGSLVKTAIDGLVASGNTCIGCGISTAQTELSINGRGGNITHVIIVLSDGYNNVGGDPTVAASAAKADGTIIFAIGIGAHNPTEMMAIASSPSSPYYSAGTADDLNNIYDEIATQICYGADPDNEVPEFGVLATLGILGLVGLFIYRKRH